MSGPLPPADPARNRQLIAERLGWPSGVIAECIALEDEFPSWAVFWSRGGLPADQLRGFRAVLVMHGHRSDLYAETIEGLRLQVAAVDAELPRGGFKPYRGFDLRRSADAGDGTLP